MGTKWRGSAGSAGSKGYLIPIKSADLDAEPRQAVISGCLADLYASAPLLDVYRDKLCKVAHVSLAAAAAAAEEDSYQKIIFSTGKHFRITFQTRLYGLSRRALSCCIISHLVTW